MNKAVFRGQFDIAESYFGARIRGAVVADRNNGGRLKVICYPVIEIDSRHAAVIFAAGCAGAEGIDIELSAVRQPGVIGKVWWTCPAGRTGRQQGDQKRTPKYTVGKCLPARKCNLAHFVLRRANLSRRARLGLANHALSAYCIV